MKVYCPHCGASEEVSASRPGSRAQCRSCGASFLVRVRLDAEESRSVAPLFMWFVRKSDGSLISFPGAEQLYHAVIHGLVETTDELSADGRTWAPVSSMPVLVKLVANRGAAAPTEAMPSEVRRALTPEELAEAARRAPSKPELTPAPVSEDGELPPWAKPTKPAMRRIEEIPSGWEPPPGLPRMVRRSGPAVGTQDASPPPAAPPSSPPPPTPEPAPDPVVERHLDNGTPSVTVQSPTEPARPSLLVPPGTEPSVTVQEPTVPNRPRLVVPEPPTPESVPEPPAAKAGPVPIAPKAPPEPPVQTTVPKPIPEANLKPAYAQGPTPRSPVPILPPPPTPKEVPKPIVPILPPITVKTPLPAHVEPTKPLEPVKTVSEPAQGEGGFEMEPANDLDWDAPETANGGGKSTKKEVSVWDYERAVRRRNFMLGSVAGLVGLLVLLLILKLALDKDPATEVADEQATASGEVGASTPETPASTGNTAKTDATVDVASAKEEARATENDELAGKAGEKESPEQAPAMAEQAAPPHVPDAKPARAVKPRPVAPHPSLTKPVPLEDSGALADGGKPPIGFNPEFKVAPTALKIPSPVVPVAPAADSKGGEAASEQQAKTAPKTEAVVAKKVVKEPEAAKEPKPPKEPKVVKEPPPVKEPKVKVEPAEPKSVGSKDMATADKLKDAGRFADAAAIYEQILASKGSSAPLHLKLADCYRKQGDCGKAIPHFTKAIALGHSKTAYIGAARCYNSMGDSEKAVDVLREGLKIHDDGVMRTLLEQFGG